MKAKAEVMEKYQPAMMFPLILNRQFFGYNIRPMWLAIYKIFLFLLALNVLQGQNIVKDLEELLLLILTLFYILIINIILFIKGCFG